MSREANAKEQCKSCARDLNPSSLKQASKFSTTNLCLADPMLWYTCARDTETRLKRSGITK